jgi:hypothetical protein
MGINDVKKGYQPRTRIVRDEKGDFVADSHSIMVRWKIFFSQILNVHGVSDVRQAEIHAAEPLVPESSAWEVELAIEKLKSHKSPSIDQIPAELIKAGSRTIGCVIHKLIIAIWNKEELPEKWKESIIVPIYKKGDKTDCNNYRGISLLPTTYKILSNNLSEMFPIRNGLKQGDALSPLLFNFALEYAIKRVQVNQDGLKLNGTHQLLAYADDVNILGGSVYTVKENAEALVVAT